LALAARSAQVYYPAAARGDAEMADERAEGLHELGEQADGSQEPNEDQISAGVIRHLAALLASGDRWNPDEVAREFGRIAVLRRWHYGLLSRIVFSMFVVLGGSLLKSLHRAFQSVSNNTKVQNMIIDISGAVGDLLTCVGVAAMLAALVVSLADIVPGKHRGLVQGTFVGIAVLVNSLWMLLYGCTVFANGNSIIVRFTGLLVLTCGGVGILWASVLSGMILFLQQCSLVERKVAAFDHVDAAGDVLPDEELLPYPPQAIRDFNGALRKSSTLTISGAWRILCSQPWRTWWFRRLLLLWAFMALALLSGVARIWVDEGLSDLRHPSNTTVEQGAALWLRGLLKILTDASGAGATLCFFLTLSLSLDFVVEWRAFGMMVVHSFNFVWLTICAFSAFFSSDAARIAVGWSTMALAIHQLSRAFLSILALIARKAHSKDHETGRMAHVSRLGKLLANGGRWCADEVWRECRRDEDLKEWHHGLVFGATLSIALIAGGSLLKDAFLLLDALGHGQMLDRWELQRAQQQVLRPMGVVLMVVGFTFFVGRVLPWFGNLALQSRGCSVSCALHGSRLIAMFANVMWLLPLAIGLRASESHGMRVAGGASFIFAIGQGQFFLTGGWTSEGYCCMPKRVRKALAGENDVGEAFVRQSWVKANIFLSLYFFIFAMVLQNEWSQVKVSPGAGLVPDERPFVAVLAVVLALLSASNVFWVWRTAIW